MEETDTYSHYLPLKKSYAAMKHLVKEAYLVWGWERVRENFTEKILPELRSEGGIGVSDIEGGDRGDLEGGADNGDGMSRAPW